MQGLEHDDGGMLVHMEHLLQHIAVDKDTWVFLPCTSVAAKPAEQGRTQRGCSTISQILVAFVIWAQELLDTIVDCMVPRSAA